MSNVPSQPPIRPLPPLDHGSAGHIEPRPHAVTWRSILLGLIGVVSICGLSPYNDWAVNNTLLTGNFLPIGVILIVLAVVLGLNAFLKKFIPAAALREGELAVSLAMMLVACSMPSSGLMRYLPAGIVNLYTRAAERPDFANLLTSVHISPWLLPVTPGTTVDEVARSDVMKYFVARSPDGHVPWGAWVRPFFSWGLFIAMVWGAMMFLSLIVRRQWVENERLAFPLATVYSALIEAPPRGRVFNNLFRSYGFWIAASVVFGVHAFNSFHEYIVSVPEIPVSYDFKGIFADAPFSYMSSGAKVQTISFSILGIAFFLQSKVAFSMWFFYVMYQVVQMILGPNQVVITTPMKQDQTFGGVMVMLIVLLWIGRAHWWMVIRHMFGRVREREDDSRYLPYAVSGWGAFTCLAGLCVWFCWLGTTVVGAIFIVLAMMMMFMVIARILAETGLIFVQINWLMFRTWYYPITIPNDFVETAGLKTTTTTFFFSGWMTQMFHDLRESFAGFFLHGIRVADGSAYEGNRRWQSSFPLILAIILALVVAYTVSWASMLKTEYGYASTMSMKEETPINPYGGVSINNNALEPSLGYQKIAEQGATPADKSTTMSISIGAAIVAACSILRLTASWWPLHPIGFVTLHSYAMDQSWFSIFLGWMAKVLMVRFGGVALLKAGRNFFIGMIVGEALVAGFWLITSLVLNYFGMEYHRIALMPG